MIEAFPSWANGSQIDGMLIKINPVCKKCSSLQCETPKNNEISECSYGFNYMKNGGLHVFGFCIPEKTMTRQKKKRIYEFPQCVLSAEVVENYQKYKSEIELEEDKKLQHQKDKIIDEYIEKEMYKSDFLANLKEDLQKNLSFLHDYQQINGTIVKNINVLILQKTKRDNIDDETLKHCSHEEVAIYFASKMLEEKIITAKALQDTSWLYRTEENRSFRVHGCIIKYIRMYKMKSDAKRLKIHILGSNTIDINRNPKAFSIIPHTLIDNAIKYAPKETEINIIINDSVYR